MEIVHWDDVPFGTVFAVSKFEDGLHKGMWGIRVGLPDGGLVWIALGSPPDLVVAPNKMMCQSILTNLRESSKMMSAAKEIGSWGNGNPTGFPDPRTFPVVSWNAVPESAPLQERQFRGEIWAVVAVMPDGEYLVIFDKFCEDAGYHTYHPDQEGARHAIAYLEMLQTPPDPDPQVETRLRRVAPTPPDSPPFGPDGPSPSDELEGTDFYLLAALDRAVESDIQRLAELEKEWRRRVKAGKKSSCLCGQCRHEIRRKVTEILDWYERPEVFEGGESVSELFLDAHRLLDLLA